ncbi:MAG: DUF4255 domain-containing protein, partial [Burkholderiales bacterium]
MSTALAIAGVTAVLRDLLNDGMINHDVSNSVGNVTVSALPPDRVIPASGAESAQINVFLHQVTPNAAWRNAALASRDASGGQRLTNPPLALDLHYLVSAYGAEDLHAEILLGYAMQLLHETPVLGRAAIRKALSPSPDVGTTLPPALRALADCGLADQYEQIRITPATMGSEEMSRLWSALQAHYRPTAAYHVSVVLIEAVQPTRASLPVLSRGVVDPVTNRDRGVVVNADMLPMLPTLFNAAPPAQQTVARLGEAVVVTGVRLAGTGAVVLLTHRLVTMAIELPVTPNIEGTELTLTLPSDAAAQTAFVPGLWQLSLRVTPTGEVNPRETNGIGLLIAADPVIAADVPLGLPVASVVRGG